MHDSVHVITVFYSGFHLMWTDVIIHIPNNNSNWLSVFLSSSSAVKDWSALLSF